MKLFNLPVLDVIHRSFVILLCGTTLYGAVGIGHLIYNRRNKLKAIEDQIRQGILPPTPVKTPAPEDKRT
ncbi:uncharacterized protein T551_02453 [Pneumocystis jirovecii RU7]|uniref:Uncharacterized protein n=1 Tax=Pneumocystis jirovecii (strain RU7) TaxID=1408657 RepID=A0A0W4ZJS1_PNEJ7|nr:uncharacterized protein T551_02453 [Pneumocystis jirovecii RU7]KTW28603.1 hypothetical protein T551_02453 [Pneumocystis jirovecii RU7]